MKCIKPFFIPLANASIAYYRMICFAQKMQEFSDVEPMFERFDPKKYNSDFEFDADKYEQKVVGVINLSDVIICQTIRDIKFGCLFKAFGEKHKLPIIMDTDDDPFSLSTDNPAYSKMGMGTNVEKAAYYQAKDADAIIVTTDYLKSCMFEYNSEIYVIPNCLDFKLWDFKKDKQNSDNLVLGWAGAAGHKKSLWIIQPVFERLLEKYPNLIIKCIHGAVDLKINHPRFYNYKNWVSIDKYPERLNSLNMDVAVAPLWDSEFNRCKSNLRYLQYSALGVPTVASNIGPYKDTINDGENGYLASSEKIFLDKISMLLDNEKLRESIGQNALQFVKSDYNLDVVSRKYADLLIEITRRHNVKLRSTTNKGFSSV